MDASDLLIPIYLDTNTLLDFLASMEDGFSIMERITSASSESDLARGEAKAEFGIGNILGKILKIDAGASVGKERSTGSQEERQQERYHTFGSLLSRLRLNLVDQSLVKRPETEDAWEEVKPSDIVEAHGKFAPSPLKASLQSVNRLLGMYPIFSGVSPQGPTPPSTKAKKSGKRKTKAGGTQNEMASLQKLFKAISKDLEPESSQTYVMALSRLPEHRMVVTLFSEYLRDRSGRELPNGEFRVLGKVVRKMEGDDSLDLLQGSLLSTMSDELLMGLLDALKELGKAGFELPELVRRVEAPALQVVPIAVYV